MECIGGNMGLLGLAGRQVVQFRSNLSLLPPDAGARSFYGTRRSRGAVTLAGGGTWFLHRTTLSSSRVIPHAFFPFPAYVSRLFS